MVDERDLELREAEVRDRVDRTRLETAPIVPCSAVTGAGIDGLRQALDTMVTRAPAPPAEARARQFIDRVFTIRGAGTVVTGTLTGGPLAVGQEVDVLPSGRRARVRGLQTHKRTLSRALPVSRVAVNLAGTTTEQIARGDVLAPAGRWRATSVFEAWIRPVRGLSHPLTSRGAYKLHAGSAERDARVHLHGVHALMSGGESFARMSLSRPVVLDVHDPFVLREAGRRETVAGGLVLDVDPPLRSGGDAPARLGARLAANREELGRLLVAERGAVRAEDIPVLVGSSADAALARGALRFGAWIVDPSRAATLGAAVTEALESHHQARPLEPGLEVAQVRTVLQERTNGAVEPGLADAIIEHLVVSGTVARTGTIVRLAERVFSTKGQPDVDRLVATVTAAEPTAPSVHELLAQGFSMDVVKAAVADGRLVRVSPDVVATPALIENAERLIRELEAAGTLTVSAFREALGTTRRCALPILEMFDASGLTRRQGDVRVLRRR